MARPIRDIHAAGHELAAHGYQHEGFDLGERKPELLEKTYRILIKTAREAPVGWCSPSGRKSWLTLPRLRRLGYRYDASEKDDDLPYLLDEGTRRSRFLRAHLGHLHHTLTPEHLKQLGRIDVALVPVDGSYPLDLDGMMDVITSLSPRVVIPMHFFGQPTLGRFLSRGTEQHFGSTGAATRLSSSRGRPFRPS